MLLSLNTKISAKPESNITVLDIVDTQRQNHKIPVEVLGLLWNETLLCNPVGSWKRLFHCLWINT